MNSQPRAGFFTLIAFTILNDKIQETTLDIAMKDKEHEKRYLVFSDKEFDLIYANQSEITVEFSEDEKNFTFLSEPESKPWKRLEIPQIFPLDKPEHTSGRAAGRFTPSKDTDFKL